MLAALIGVSLFTACGADTAARVDGTEITMTELDRELDAMLSNPAYVAYLKRVTERDIIRDGLAAEFVSEVLTGMITAVVLDDERDRGVTVTDEDRKQGELEASANAGSASILRAFPAWYREEVTERAAVRVALRRSLVATITPESYYEEHRADFVRPCVRHILVATRADAKRARDRVLTGGRFADIARELSLDDGTGPKGGDLGCNDQGHLAGPLDRAALEQPVGAVGPAIQTRDGYHILLVESRRIPPFEQIRGRVNGAITRLGYERLAELADRRLEEADITVSDRIGRWAALRVVAR